jgi:hypothetical protein
MRMGGVAPLRYAVRDRKLVIVEREAETVRHIFHRYPGLGSVRLLQQELEAHGIGGKKLDQCVGCCWGGKPNRPRRALLDVDGIIATARLGPLASAEPEPGNRDVEAMRIYRVPPVRQCPTEIFRSSGALHRRLACLYRLSKSSSAVKVRKTRYFLPRFASFSGIRRHRYRMAGGLGFEPRLAESESAVLPLDDPPSGPMQRFPHGRTDSTAESMRVVAGYASL